jgi:hypothetical protein
MIFDNKDFMLSNGVPGGVIRTGSFYLTGRFF